MRILMPGNGQLILLLLGYTCRCWPPAGMLGCIPQSHLKPKSPHTPARSRNPSPIPTSPGPNHVYSLKDPSTTGARDTIQHNRGSTQLLPPPSLVNLSQSMPWAQLLLVLLQLLDANCNSVHGTAGATPGCRCEESTPTCATHPKCMCPWLHAQGRLPPGYTYCARSRTPPHTYTHCITSLVTIPQGRSAARPPVMLRPLPAP